MWKTLFNKYRSLIFYGIFGVMTTAINVAVYVLCFDHFYIENVPSTIIAWVIAVAFAFFTNKIWVFESTSFSTSVFFSELWKFVSCRLATGALDLAIMYIGVDVLSGPAALVKLGSNILVILLNYLLSKILIFRGK